jgi:methionyl aminopeptidase
MIKIKTDAQIQLMRESGRLTKDVLDYLEKNIKVGITTKQLDKIERIMYNNFIL